jgi:hypothetical protein
LRSHGQVVRQSVQCECVCVRVWGAYTTRCVFEDLQPSRALSRAGWCGRSSEGSGLKRSRRRRTPRMRKQLIRLQLTTPCTASIRRQKFSKVIALCLILYTSWDRTLTFQNLCQTSAPQTSALVAAADAGNSAHAQDLPPGNDSAPHSSRETQPETRGAPGGGGEACPAHAPEPTPASPRPSPRPPSAAPAPSVSAAAPSATADAVAPTQAGPRNT